MSQTHRLRFPVGGLVVAVVLGAGVLCGGGCSRGTRVVDSWKAPDVAGPLQFKKILVVAVHPDLTTRKLAEDELVRQIGAARAVAGESVMPGDGRGDPQALAAKAKEIGADGLVTMRIGAAVARPAPSAGSDSYAPDSFRRDPDRNMFASEDPGGATPSERSVSIRTDLYAVADDKLVWSGVTESFDPRDTRSLIAGIAKAVRARLKKEHLIE
jgi:hypothetical protein